MILIEGRREFLLALMSQKRFWRADYAKARFSEPACAAPSGRMEVIMKSKVRSIKVLAAIISLLLVLSFASCSASPDEEWFDDGWDNIGGNNQAPANTEEEANDENAEEGEVDKNDHQDPTFVENPFVSTAENNISTFSADVDTASYSYFRKLVNKGYTLDQLTASGSVFRTEEFINYFRYDVPTPAENELFGVRTELSHCPWNEKSLLLRLTLQAEQAIDAGGNNLVFLIDVSGSMSSTDKLPLLKKAFSYLVNNLDVDDTVSIVTYSGREAVVLEGCNGLESERIMDAINNLSAYGSTNGEAGLTQAYRIAEAYFKADGNNRIIMASDGDLNVGISSEDELKTYIEDKREQGVYLSVLGFGTGNYQDGKMEALADNGNGVYYYIDGESEAEKVFGSDLLGTLYTVAEDVKLQLEFNPDKVESYRLVGYENRVMDNEDFENDKKDAGEVGVSHQVTVCYEIKLVDHGLRIGSATESETKISDGTESSVIETESETKSKFDTDTEAGESENGESSVDFIKLRVRYKNIGETISLLNEYEISEEVVTDMSDDQRFICAVVELGMILHNSDYIGDINIDSVIEELDTLVLTDPYKAEFRELLRGLAE